MKNIKNIKEKEIEKLSNLKKGLYEDWKNEYITKEEYLEYKKKYENDIKKIKEVIVNLEKQKNDINKVEKKNNLWLENLKKEKNIINLDRDVIAEIIDYIEIHENKKITIHFKFMNEFDKSLEIENKY